MKKRISLLAIALTIFIITSAVPSFAADEEVTVILDGRRLSFDSPPQIVNDRVLVPLRVIFEAMGATVEWNNNTQTVTATKDSTVVVLTIGDVSPMINGQEVSIDQPGIIVEGRTLAPLRFVAEAFDGTVLWDGNTKVALIAAGTDVELNQIIFVSERVGDVTFHRPIHWAGLADQVQEGASLEFWDAFYDKDQPFFRVRQLPLEGETPSLDDLLATMLAEERIDVINAEVAPADYPIDAAVVFGTNIDEDAWQKGMYEYDIRFVYDDWLYVITAWYKDISNHQELFQSMIQSMAVAPSM